MDAVMLGVYCVLQVSIAVAAFLCWRRTRVRAFLFLGAVLVLWHWFDYGSALVVKHFLGQANAGERPWLFPFSLMVKGNEPERTRLLFIGEFLYWFDSAKRIVHLALLAAAVALIARAFKRGPTAGMPAPSGMGDDG